MTLGAASVTLVHAQKSADDHETGSLQTQPILETESGMQESTTEQDNDWLAAHESNGPEGVRGVPMQRMSLFQAGLVLVMLTAGGGLAALAKKNDRSGTSPRP